MILSILGRGKHAVAELARVRLLASVRALVHQQVPPLAVRLSALLAYEGLESGVGQTVPKQLGGRLERLLADNANVLHNSVTRGSWYTKSLLPRSPRARLRCRW